MIQTTRHKAYKSLQHFNKINNVIAVVHSYSSNLKKNAFKGKKMEKLNKKKLPLVELKFKLKEDTNQFDDFNNRDELEQ